MSGFVLSAVRTAAQAAVGYLVLFLASHGIDVPINLQNWVVQVVLVGGAAAGVTLLVRWLETRQGDSGWARLARLLARLLKLGLDGKIPVYVPVGSKVVILHPSGEMEPVPTVDK